MMRNDSLLKARILIVDDQQVNLQLLDLMLRREGFSTIRMLSDPYAVIPTYVEYQPDIILLDLLMPGMDGFAIIELLRRRIPAEEFLPILVLTADVTVETRRRALALGAKDFLTKPFDQIEVTLRLWNLLETRFLFLRLERYNKRLGVQLGRGQRELDAAQRLTQAAEFRDEESVMHTQRVGRLAALLARAIGLGEEQVELARYAASPHNGCPHALKGAAVSIEARIVAVADAFDSLTHERPYRPACSLADAISAIRACSGTRYDPEVVSALSHVLVQEGLLPPNG